MRPAADIRSTSDVPLEESIPATSRAAIDVTVLPLSFLILTPDDILRRRCEQFIVDQYSLHFQAAVSEFLPWLALTQDPANQIAAVVGIQPATDTTPLFLEQYLSQSIEEALSTITGSSVCRRRIAEIGNLATASPAGLNWLYFGLTAMFSGWGFSWAVFTATRSIRRALGRLGVPLLEVGPAQPERLLDSSTKWGTYYDQDPRVMAANVADTRQIMQANSSLYGPGAKLWDSAFELGRAQESLCSGVRCNRQR